MKGRAAFGKGEALSRRPFFMVHALTKLRTNFNVVAKHHPEEPMPKRVHHLFLRNAFIAALSCWLANSALAQTVLYYRFTPMVVRANETQPVLFEARLIGLPTRVTLASDFAGSNVVATLLDDGSNGDRQAGDGIYSTNLPAATVVQGLQPNDVFRKLLGYLIPYQGTTIQGRYNTFVQISTPDIPRVVIRQLAPDVQCSDYIVNIMLPTYFSNTTTNNDYTALARKLYQHFRDDYDQLNMVANQSYIANRFHFGVKNDVQGIGLMPFNRTADYGSSGRLQGISVYNNAGFFDGADNGFQHEFGHQWIQFLQQPPFATGVPHWPYSSMASGIMGFSIGGQGGQGGDYRCRVTPEGNTVRLTRDNESEVFKDLDLYLMGLLPADQVGTNYIFDNQSDPAITQCNGLYAGAITRVNIANIVAAFGQRVPSAATSQKQFRLANIVVSANGLLSEEAMAYYDFFARRAEATQELTSHIGLVSVRVKPFALSTGGLGSLVTKLGVAKTAPLAAVTATSYVADRVARESIVAAFGTNLAGTTTVANSIPLPTSLAGTSIRLRDAGGTEHPVPLFFVSPQQVNLLIPANAALGNATLMLTSSNGPISEGMTTIVSVSPGLFTANANGQGVAAAVLLRIRADGSLSYESILQFDSATNRFVPTPINLGATTDQLFLLLFGSGIRGVSGLSAVSCSIGGENAAVLFAGQQGDFEGLDQVNVTLPRSLAGRGLVNLSLSVAGFATNIVQIHVQ
jgi:uncharacterized protein (TIGR03437 family)